MYVRLTHPRPYVNNALKEIVRNKAFCAGDFESIIVLDANGDRKDDLVCKYPDDRNYKQVFNQRNY